YFAGLLLLCKKGIVFRYRKTWGEAVYFVPDEHFPEWQQRLFSPPVQTEPPSDFMIEHTGFMTLTERMYTFVSYVRDHGLQFTHRGTLHKRQLKALDGLLWMDEEVLQALKLDYPAKEHHSNRFAIMYDLAL